MFCLNKVGSLQSMWRGLSSSSDTCIQTFKAIAYCYMQLDIIVNYRVTASAFHNNLELNLINPQINVGQGLGIEIIMTFTLVFVVMATTDPDRTDGGNTAVAVGLTVAGLILTGVRSLFLKNILTM